MIVGIGTDLVYIPRIRKTIDDHGEVFTKRTFTKKENDYASGKRDVAAYYATLFACKEAVFKAMGHSTGEGFFDFRIVEVLHHEDGAPYVNITDGLRPYMLEAGISSFLVSVSHENDYVIAFVAAQ